MSYIYETSLLPKSAMASPEMNLQFFFHEHLSPFDSTIDSFIQTVSDNSNQQNQVDNSGQLQDLCFNQSQNNHLNSLANNYSPEFCFSQNAQNVKKFMQRSYSSNAFDQQTELGYKPHLNTLMKSEPSKFHNLNKTSPEERFFIERMRKVSSTGDLQSMKTNYVIQGSFSGSTATERSIPEEPSFKVGRYSAEEKKVKIEKYRAKRSQRNFNKTIKYTCRKTLADTRPRVRGRFARNDEVSEIPKAACSISTSRDEDEYELWLNEFHGQAYGTGRGHFVNSYGIAQYEQYGY